MVAQRKEQGPSKSTVTGSIPVRRTPHDLGSSNRQDRWFWSIESEFESLPQSYIRLMLKSIRLCVESGAQIDHGNYQGPIHCVMHPDGHACVTGLYELAEGSVDTAADRQASVTGR